MIIDNFSRRFVGDIRLYNINGEELSSVTTICHYNDEDAKTGLKIWKKNQKYHDIILKYASTLGTIVHWRSQQFLANKWGFPLPELELNDDNIEIMNSEYYHSIPFETKQGYSGLQNDIDYTMALFKGWVKENNPKPPLIDGIYDKVLPFETNAYSFKYGYAGSVDLPCNIDGVNHIVDLKSNIHIHSSYRLQLTAYQIGLEERFPNNTFPKLAILNLSLTEDEAIFRHVEPKKYAWLKTIKEFYIDHDLPEFKNTRKRVLNNLKNIVITPKEEKKE